MSKAMTKRVLASETASFRGTGGVSEENGCYGFRPAFMDSQSHTVYASCFADGRPAPFHLLDGLPDAVVLERDPSGKVTAVKASVISGFVFEGQFYTREDAARRMSELRLEHAHSALAEANRALAASTQQLRAAQRQIDALTECNSRLTLQEAEARRLAYSDELTGLPNRRMLLDRLKQAMAQGSRRHKQVALLFLDLVGFKSVNDRFGHAAGDKLLQQVAERLTACIRGGDTACRYGGDEFVIMLPEVDGQESIVAVAQKICDRLAEPYVVDGSAMPVRASIGAVVYSVDGQSYRDLIKQADIAMYQAKMDGNPLT